MLSVFASELTATQSELEALLAKAQALRGQMKSLKAAQNKALKVVDKLKNLVSELPELAIAELKKEILSLFPIDPEPAEVFTNFVTEVPETEVTTPKIAKNEEVNDRWNPAHFGDLHFNAEDNGQLNLLQPTTTEPPEPDDYPDLASFEAAWTEWKLEQEGEAEEELAHVCAKDFFNAIDLSSANWEELKTALKPVVMFIKKYDGELLAGYIACAKRELATDWIECLALWGCRAEARKAKRFGKGIRWEVKVTKISMEQLITVANHHGSLYDSVPKQSEQLNMKPASENGNVETKEIIRNSASETSLSDEDVEVIAKGEAVKSDLFPQHFSQDERKCFPNDLIRVNQSCHHTSVIGLTGKVVTSTPTGCIARFEEIGNRWLINSQFEVVKEQALVS